MSNIDKQSLREAAEKANPEQYGYYLIDAFTDLATPATVLALLDELEAAQSYAKERDEENQDLMLTVGRLRVERETSEAEMDDALCQLLPGVQYMDPPDGGSVTPLEQVRRMVTDYRERLKIAESRCDHRSKFWDVSGVQRCTLCDKAISSDGDQQTADLLAAGIITKVGE